MANEEHVKMLKHGARQWNSWRKRNPGIKPDLRDAELQFVRLTGANLNEADLEGADLSFARLPKARLRKAKLSNANLLGVSLRNADLCEAELFQAEVERINLSNSKLCGAHLSGVNFAYADVTGADFSHASLAESTFFATSLCGVDFTSADLTFTYLNHIEMERAILAYADLEYANLVGANLKGVDLTGANLSKAVLVETNLEGATLSGCRVYGTSVWNVKLDEAQQSDLIITDEKQATITVDNLEVAQFIFLLLNNQRIREVLDTITSKVVLILGRFTPERKAVLDAIREELRKHNYLPVMFDFEKPQTRNLTQTVSTLAHLSRFVIADITDPRSIPQELERIVPHLTKVPIVPIMETSSREYGMFMDFADYPWVLTLYKYQDLTTLLKQLPTKVIARAERKALQLQKQARK